MTPPRLEDEKIIEDELQSIYVTITMAICAAVLNRSKIPRAQDEPRTPTRSVSAAFDLRNGTKRGKGHVPETTSTVHAMARIVYQRVVVEGVVSRGIDDSKAFFFLEGLWVGVSTMCFRLALDRQPCFNEGLQSIGSGFKILILLPLRTVLACNWVAGPISSPADSAKNNDPHDASHQEITPPQHDEFLVVCTNSRTCSRYSVLIVPSWIFPLYDAGWRKIPRSWMIPRTRHIPRSLPPF